MSKLELYDRVKKATVAIVVEIPNRLPQEPFTIIGSGFCIHSAGIIVRHGTAMKVYGYCRVSRAEKVSGGMSLETQQQQITGYAMMKGWQVAQFYVEDSISGGVPLADWAEGQKLLACMEQGDVIITAKLDRAFR
jgi:hypothetical protein